MTYVAVCLQHKPGLCSGMCKVSVSTRVHAINTNTQGMVQCAPVLSPQAGNSTLLVLEVGSMLATMEVM